MFIHEAIQACSQEALYITREAWLLWEPDKPLKKAPETAFNAVLPTRTPNGCIFFSRYEKAPRVGWQPTAEDLVADDWWPTMFREGTFAVALQERPDVESGLDVDALVDRINQAIRKQNQEFQRRLR